MASSPSLSNNSPHKKPYRASCYRLIYWLCWKSRLIVPLILASVTFALFIGLVEWRETTTTTQLMMDGGVPRLGPEPASAAMHALWQRHIRGATDSSSPKPQSQMANSDQLNASKSRQQDSLPARKPADSVHSLQRLAYRERSRSQSSGLSIKRPSNRTDQSMGTLQAVINTKPNTTARHKQKPSRPKKHQLFAQLNFEPGRGSKLYYNASQTMPITFETWLENEAQDCSGKFRGYLGEFAHVEDVIISRRSCRGARLGGELLGQVLNQSEDREYIEIKHGCFQLSCPQKIDYFFNGENHLNSWILNLQYQDVQMHRVKQVNPQFTIAVTRYEYVNMYHSMTDWYNAFLMMNFFNRTQTETNILIVDAHPQGALDSVWLALFNSTSRLSAIGPRTLYKDMVWGMMGYSSPFTDHLEMSIPLIEEFREFFLDSYRIDDSRQLNCDRLSVLFVWRHNYVAHPRNPTGAISRKIMNEKALLMTAQRLYPHFHIQGLQLDMYEMEKQLEIIAQTDILIGMHGAGLTHAVFLPKHAGVIEFIPSYWSAANEHFMAIAGWRKLIYERWTNAEETNEFPDHYTYIPLHVEKLLLQTVVERMCDRDDSNRTIPAA